MQDDTGYGMQDTSGRMRDKKQKPIAIATPPALLPGTRNPEWRTQKARAPEFPGLQSGTFNF